MFILIFWYISQCAEKGMMLKILQRSPHEMYQFTHGAELILLPSFEKKTQVMKAKTQFHLMNIIYLPKKGILSSNAFLGHSLPSSAFPCHMQYALPCVLVP